MKYLQLLGKVIGMAVLGLQVVDAWVAVLGMVLGAAIFVWRL